MSFALKDRCQSIDSHWPLCQHFFLGGRAGEATHDAGWSSLVARWAHNPKVAGSNPAPATNQNSPVGQGFTPNRPTGLSSVSGARSNGEVTNGRRPRPRAHWCPPLRESLRWAIPHRVQPTSPPRMMAWWCPQRDMTPCKGPLFDGFRRPFDPRAHPGRCRAKDGAALCPLQPLPTSSIVANQEGQSNHPGDGGWRDSAAVEDRGFDRATFKLTHYPTPRALAFLKQRSCQDESLASKP